MQRARVVLSRTRDRAAQSLIATTTSGRRRPDRGEAPPARGPGACPPGGQPESCRLATIADGRSVMSPRAAVSPAVRQLLTIGLKTFLDSKARRGARRRMSLETLGFY